MIDRKMPRAVWYLYYRQLRIRRRETDKAMVDAMISGIGFVRTDGAGFVNHVKPEAIYQ